jgi:hypothetical protein
MPLGWSGRSSAAMLPTIELFARSHGSTEGQRCAPPLDNEPLFSPDSSWQQTLVTLKTPQM